MSLLSSIIPFMNNAQSTAGMILDGIVYAYWIIAIPLALVVTTTG